MVLPARVHNHYERTRMRLIGLLELRKVEGTTGQTSQPDSLTVLGN